MCACTCACMCVCANLSIPRMSTSSYNLIESTHAVIMTSNTTFIMAISVNFYCQYRFDMSLNFA